MKANGLSGSESILIWLEIKREVYHCDRRSSWKSDLESKCAKVNSNLIDNDVVGSRRGGGQQPAKRLIRPAFLGISGSRPARVLPISLDL